MKALTSFLAVLALAAPLSSCAPSFDTPPDLQPLLEAYAQPTAVVGSQIMSAVADEIAEAAEWIEDSEVFEEILQVIIDVQQELDAATVTVKTCNGGAMSGSDCSADTDCPDGTCVSTGNIVVGQTCEDGDNKGNECVDDTDCPGGTCGGGVLIPTPTGQIRVNYICPGVDERQFDPDYLNICDGGANAGSACAAKEDCPDGACVKADPDNGTINLTMTLDSRGIGRVVWGTADNCLYLVPIEGGNCEAAGCYEASYDGGVAVDLGDPEPSGQDITELIVTFLLEGTIGFDGDTYRINQSFRVVLALESALEILVDVGEPALAETFNYFFVFEGLRQGIRDANGLFGCSLEDSRCFDQDDNTLFSW